MTRENTSDDAPAHRMDSGFKTVHHCMMGILQCEFLVLSPGLDDTEQHVVGE